MARWRYVLVLAAVALVVLPSLGCGNGAQQAPLIPLGELFVGNQSPFIFTEYRLRIEDDPSFGMPGPIPYQAIPIEDPLVPVSPGSRTATVSLGEFTAGFYEFEFLNEVGERTELIQIMIEPETENTVILDVTSLFPPSPMI